MKLFNFNFFWQNLKKSRIILLLFTLLIPIINTLILISQATNNVYIPSFLDISMFNVIAIYILPIIIAVCLFSYIFKKQSVDFINSMPINRKSIYVTNVISGLLLILTMLIINVILIFLVGIIFNVPIPFMMLVDYIFIWFLEYLFVLSASILAMCVSGNAITGVVVTLILVFFIPFSKWFIGELKYSSINNNYLLEVSDKTLIDNYNCFSDKKCLDNLKLNRYEVNLREEKEDNVNLLETFFEMSANNKSSYTLYSNIELIILSVLYLILGYVLFNERKMEINETSFRNIHIHNIIKNLTLLPFVAISYVVIKEEYSIISIVFVFVILLVYSIIYDLITKKGLHNFKVSAFYFILFICLYFVVFALNDIVKENDIVINYNDIESCGIEIEKVPNSDIIYIKNDELKELIIRNMYNYDYYNEVEKEYVTAYLKLKNNKKYSLTLYLDSEYDKIMNILYQDNDYNKKYKDIDYDNVYAVMVGNILYNTKDRNKLIGLIKDGMEKLSLKDFVLLKDEVNYNVINSIGYNIKIKLYSYFGHERYEYNIWFNINDKILDYVVNTNNKYLKKDISNVIPLDYKLYYVGHNFDSRYEINYNIMYNSKNELYNYILKSLDDNVDMSKEYIALSVCFDKKCYDFVSNNIVEFKKILDDKYNYLKENNELVDF